MRSNVEHNLQEIGLSDKEAKVYMASLAIGPATAQTLAAKATVNRPTTYVMIESLMKRGLMSEVERGGKRFFAAARPEQLLQLTAGERRDLERREAIVQGILPALSALASDEAAKTVVRTFEGEDAWTALQRDILASGATTVVDIVPAGAEPACMRGELVADIKAACRITALAKDAMTCAIVLYGSKVFLAPGSGAAPILIDDATINASLLALATADEKTTAKSH